LKAEPVWAIKQFLPAVNPGHFYGPATLQRLEKKTAVNFTLDGSEVDKYVMNAINLAAARMHNSRDTMSYIKVALQESITYERVVSLIDMMMVEGYPRYMFWKDDFYILPSPIDELTVRTAIKRT
jgi:hypothetical protein